MKNQLLRVTLHAVAAEDYPTVHEAMQGTLRAARLYDRRFRSEGVSIEDTDALIPDLLEFTATPRTNPDVERWLEAALRRAETPDLVGPPPVRAVRASHDRGPVVVRRQVLLRRGAQPGAHG